MNFELRFLYSLHFSFRKKNEAKRTRRCASLAKNCSHFAKPRKRASLERFLVFDAPSNNFLNAARAKATKQDLRDNYEF